ncbi:hypothetical protein GLOIN_2v1770668 [Rhizophagus irregularis DAOM 181602=DAOM 197198]|nr:hypothetical protein GLOIN_2v1770668 [Rhizophagus irregularis DAOM 181602=DAOM 197198]
MEYSITDYDYCIRELESMISYDGPPDNAFSYAPDSYPNDAGWNNCHHEFDNNTSSSLPIHAYSNLSIMDTSSDTFFSTFDPNFILSSRHAILPARVTFGDSSRLRQKISFISNTQQNLSNHTGRKLSGRQEILIIGAYVPPSSRLNSKLISNCHSTLVSWITTACSAGIHILLDGDLNAEFNCYLKNISDPSISSPTHSLFRYLHSHQFEDLCAFDSSSSPLPTFRSLSSKHLSHLDYL